jgi:5-oxoprolinase (ATP-hydrolysing)
MNVAILSTRRQTSPFGLNGGGAGARGKNIVTRANGECVSLQGCDEMDVAPGDSITIETPGGGGFGKRN